ncbi:hypothetical protein ASE12_12650 [Aeromicrobium sp. Root236]|uniref:hypothetical protein n=1 Tax=Aeromicrobium sp. Root236 TaxID=1736498 RepID=UPI0006FB2EBC|nr:hypothetical protein [Aeromicrobium sp. Root236]KRC65527.1 hypothetical protein ASE12_12650 [Aeromicrobium sp. Root236]
MNRHIVDALRPELPDLDPYWEAETVRAILEDRTGGATADRPVRRRLVSATLIAAAVAVFIGGVAVARHALPSDDVRPAKPIQDKIQKIDPSKATKLKLGDTLDVAADLPKTYNGDDVLFSGFAGSKALVGSATQVQDESAPNAKPLMPSHPVLYELDTKTFTVLDDRDRPEPTQILNASGDGETVVWAELVGVSPSTTGFAIYSYDRRTGGVTTLDAFDDPNGEIIYGDDLALAGDMAYFSTFANPAKKGRGVYAVPVDGSRPPSLIAEGGEAVRISGDTLTFHLRDPKANEGDRRYFTYDLRTGETTPVPVSSHAGDPRFCGAELTPAWETWCIGGDLNDGVPAEPAILTIKEASGRTTRFAPFNVGSADFPVPHDVIALGPWTGIAVTTENGHEREFLVDLETKEVKVFPDNTSFIALSPDRSEALISSFASKGRGPQRIVQIPES